MATNEQTRYYMAVPSIHAKRYLIAKRRFGLGTEHLLESSRTFAHFCPKRRRFRRTGPKWPGFGGAGRNLAAIVELIKQRFGTSVRFGGYPKAVVQTSCWTTHTSRTHRSLYNK
jgi:hypothetical protein